jgi:4-amino-4-deoxy-L-arabinose transferase-like glycosyltransferase
LVTAGFFFLFGPSYFSSRVTSTFFSILTLIVTYFLGKEFYDKKVAILAMLLTAFSPYFFLFSHLAMQDIPLTFFVLLSTLLFYRAVEKDRKYFIYFGFVFGIGYMLKYMIIVLAFPFFLYLIFRRKCFQCAGGLIKSVVVFLMTISPYLLIQIFYKGFSIITYWTGGGPGSVVECSWFSCPLEHLFFYYELLYFQIFIPVFFIPAIYFSIKRKHTYENFLLSLIVFSYFFIFTILPLKTHKYTIPIIPFLSLLCVYSLNKMKRFTYQLFFIFLLLPSILIYYLYPPYTGVFSPYLYNFKLNEIATTINKSLVKNGNLFLLSGVDYSGFIFSFASINNFNNHVLRWRECGFTNMSKEDFMNFLEKNNIYLVISLKTDEVLERERLRKYLDETFIQIPLTETLILYQNPQKDFLPVKEICDYNCKIKELICYKFS